MPRKRYYGMAQWGVVLKCQVLGEGTNAVWRSSCRSKLNLVQLLLSEGAILHQAIKQAWIKLIRFQPRTTGGGASWEYL